MAAYDDQNWDINSYNNAYGNTSPERWQGENDFWQNMDSSGNYRPPGSFFPSGIGSFYNQRPVYPGQRNIHEGFGTADVSSTFEAPERTGILENFKNKLSGFTTPTMAFLNKAFKPNEQMEAAINEIQETGSFGGQKYNIDMDRNKIYSEVNPFGKNLRSGFGSNDPTEMDNKTLAWAMDRISKGKAISTRLRNILQNRGMLNVTGVDRVGGDTTEGGFITQKDTGAPVTTGGGGTFNPVFDQGPRYGGPTGPAPSWHGATRAREALSRSTGGKQGQVAGPGFGQGSYWAEGGRVGYQDGELVEDEYMAEATPGGMMEENIEEVQGEPTREQLEAIALEIFRLPLEQLNEEQLEIVYQTAMEQEPSEEEVQFAAQEGPGEGIASLV